MLQNINFKKMKKILSFLFAVALVTGVSVVPAYAVTFTTAEVAGHNTAGNCWMIVNGKVYNLTGFPSLHSGGSSAIVSRCGTDGSTTFNAMHGSGTLSALTPYYIGDVGTAQTSLTAPSGLAGVAGQTSIALSWNTSTGGIAPITYTILRNNVTVGTVSGTSFTDTGLAPSTSYSYSVRAMDSKSPTPTMMTSSSINVTTLTVSPATPSRPSSEEDDDEDSVTNEQRAKKDHREWEGDRNTRKEHRADRALSYSYDRD
jgi:predicted heme/steroid binding protein